MANKINVIANPISKDEFERLSSSEKKDYVKVSLEDERQRRIVPFLSEMTETEIRETYNAWSLRLYKKRIIALCQNAMQLTGNDTEKQVYQKEMGIVTASESVSSIRDQLLSFPHGDRICKMQSNYSFSGTFVNPGVSKTPLKTPFYAEYLSIREATPIAPYVAAGSLVDEFDLYLDKWEYDCYCSFSPFSYKKNRKNLLEDTYEPFVRKAFWAMNEELITSSNEYRSNPDSRIFLSKNDSREADMFSYYGHSVEFPCEWNEYCDWVLEKKKQTSEAAQRAMEEKNKAFTSFLNQ